MEKEKFDEKDKIRKPLVSVIIPTYNGAKTIKRAIRSVLEQTYTNIEIIVVDDCSTDDTVEVVESINEIVLIKHKENRNGSAARNSGVREARGEYIAFLDDDDEWVREKIEKQVEYLGGKDSNEWKACITTSIRKQGVSKIPREGNITEDILNMRSNFSMGSSLLIEKGAVEEVGYFDEKYSRHQDQEFVLRYLRFYKLAVLQEPLLKRNLASGVPNGEKLLEVKNLFLSDFKEDIEGLGPKKAKQIYARQWLQVSKHFALNGDVKQTFKYLKRSLSFALLFSPIFKVTPFEGYITTVFALIKSILCVRKTKDRFTKKRKELNILVFAGCRDEKLNSKLSPLLESTLVKNVFLIRKKWLNNSHPKLKQYYPRGVFSKVLLLRELSRVIFGFKVLIGNDIDLLLGIHYRMHSIYTYLFSKIFRKKYGLLIIESPKRYKKGKTLYRKVLEGASFLGVRGQNSMQYVLDLGINKEHLFISRNEFQISSDEIKEKKKVYDLIYIGNFVDVKDLPLWVEIVAEVKKRNRDVRAVMLGDGERYEDMRRMIKERGLEESIRLVGRKKNVYGYIDRSKILLMTSKSEGLPMVVVEAMSRGVLSVVPDVGDITDLVEHEVNGIVIEGRDPKEYAEEIVKILENDNLYEKMSKAAKQSVEQLALLCDIETLTKEWNEVLSNISFEE